MQGHCAIAPVAFELINVGLAVCDEDFVKIATLVPELRDPARDEAASTINLISVVVDEDYKLRGKGDVKKMDLGNEVWLVLSGTKKARH